ncbi:MAG: SMC family ATPase [Candidatus Bathyarchaeota archaeon]|nr:MAG: SMC family ATPase [Candidatus Bathyarchaeota archaeon]
MRIKSISLENIRSHVKSRVDFGKGFNCLVGGLGTGKSSILYAIDFVFFGDPLTRSYHYLLREGESMGKVSVEFLLNGKMFRLERGLKRRGKGIGQDVENLNLFRGDKLIASMKNEAVSEQLETITGLDKEIFREVVWIRQEHLKELLDVTPRERQKRLDQLFGLSDYEVAWNNIRGVQREYEVEMKAYEKDFDVLGIEKLDGDYHDALEEYSSLENETLNLESKRDKVKAELTTFFAKLQSLEKLRNQTEELLKKEAELRTNLTNTEDMCARLASEIQRKTGAVSEFDQRLKSLETRLNSQKEQLAKIGLAPDSSIEELKHHLASFDEQLTSLKAEQETARKETSASKQRASTLAAESKCPLCLQPLPEDYKMLMLQNIETENQERDGRLAELRGNMTEVETLRNIVNNAIYDLKSQSERILDLKARIIEEHESGSKLENEFQEQQSQEKTYRTKLQEIRQEIQRFDISELENTRKLHETANSQLLTITKELEFNRSQKETVSLKIENLRERLEYAQKKMERVGRIRRLLETVDGIREAYRSIQPKLRVEFIKILERVIQRVLDTLTGEEDTSLLVHIDETYTPSIKSLDGYTREVSYLSGGERTLLAFAYRFALGQLIMQARTGHGLQMLLLDEPTESLGREDQSVDRLAEAIARLKAIDQIIAVTHNEAFAEKADHVIRLQKADDTSRVVVEQ